MPKQKSVQNVVEMLLFGYFRSCSNYASHQRRNNYLNEALTKLAEFDETKAGIVKMRHFGGLNVKEAAVVLQLSRITVMRH